MTLEIDRRWPKSTYTIGRLYVDGEFFCNTLEDKDRGLKQTDALTYIQARKVAGETAIPKGTYGVSMDTTSPKYAGVSWYWRLCRGKMPRLIAVPGFDGILIHPGNTALDTKGCILVGKNTAVGRLTESKEVFKALYKKMEKAAKNGEKIIAVIK